METVEEAPVHISSTDCVKVNLKSGEPATLSPEPDVCQASNGVVVATDVTPLQLKCNDENLETSNNSTAPESVKSISEIDGGNVNSCDDPDAPGSNTDLPTALAVTAEVLEEQLGDLTNSNVSSIHQIDPSDDGVVLNEPTVKIDQMETFHSDNVTFETEILVETNDNDINELNLNESKPNVHLQESANNILNELGQNIELSEALRASDNADSGENNNHNVGQEVFNKEELIDILEGKDMPTADIIVGYEIHNERKSKESQLALQQLSRLKMNREKKTRHTNTMPVKKLMSITKRKSEPNRTIGHSKKERSIVNESVTNTVDSKKKLKNNIDPKKDQKCNVDPKKDLKNNVDSKKDESIVNVLVKDWEDDEPGEEDLTDDLKEKHDISIERSDQLVNVLESTQSKDITTETVNSSDVSVLNKSNDDGLPQRRLGRVIKKKVIFDPDNPDTFTKSKLFHKNKEMETDKDEAPSKKVKVEHTHRPKSKSPVSKLQWKKPPPKNNKQTHRRLTEVDKLLMDEGAVNMIYQLTPEAPKGKKNMRTKAEFIKKIQSSTPESNEMKFRERKKEASRGEEGEAKKILGGKQRPSLSSIKSPSACEDFETHSADDSIIYRRHSSSSYSSACMSPRCLSDVEVGANQSVQSKASRNTDMLLVNRSGDATCDVTEDVFMTDASNISSGEIINKNDCLSIKEKLNSKLSLALNKRKRESSKTEKPVKQKKVKSEIKIRPKEEVYKYKHLMIIFDQRVAEICIQTTGLSINLEVLKEMEHALKYVDTKKDTSITLLTSECGTLCSELDLRLLVDNDVGKRNNAAYELAESIRSLLCAVSTHSKLVCMGAGAESPLGASCSGVALALLALSDVALASECASFAAPSIALQPGLAALSVRPQPLPQSLINDMVIFGRKLTASDALRVGLVSRVLWPDGFLDQLRSISRDIAAQPVSNLLLKKRLLNLNNVSNTTFLSCLEKERDLFVEYWTSVEGQELLRASLGAA